MVAQIHSPKTRGPKLDLHQVLLWPLITEKGTHLSTHENHNAYTFQVNLWATKEQIKAAIQELFNVRVLKVRTQMRLGKKRRFRQKVGRMANWKKAIVKLHPEDRIEFF